MSGGNALLLLLKALTPPVQPTMFQRARTWWRCRRDGVTAADVEAACEAAALVKDFRLVESLCQRYALNRCARCAQRFLHERGHWAAVSANADPGAFRPAQLGSSFLRRNLVQVRAGSGIETIRTCHDCWYDDLPEGWFRAAVIPKNEWPKTKES